MVRYSYYCYSAENLHVVMATRDNSDGTVSVRPVYAYFQEKSAKEYIHKVNERIANHDRSYLRVNPPVRYFGVPEWWSEKFPNWSHMKKVV